MGKSPEDGFEKGPALDHHRTMDNWVLPALVFHLLTGLCGYMKRPM